MDDMIKQVLEIVKAQASVRQMTEEEIVSMVKKLTASLGGVAEAVGNDVIQQQEPACDTKKSIREGTVVCLECGKSFKVITNKHLAEHGLDKDGYLAKWGLPKGTALACKRLVRERRKTMKDMKLWERRGSKGNKQVEKKS